MPLEHSRCGAVDDLICDGDVIAGCVAARRVALSAMEKGAKDTELDWKIALDLLREKEGILKSMDPSFVLEFAALEALGGEGGESLMTKFILTSVPDSQCEAVAVSNVLERLTSLTQTSFFAYTNEKAKSYATLALETVRTMHNGEAPDISRLQSGSGDFWKSFLDRLPWLASCPCGEGGAFVFGLESLRGRLALCQSLHEKGELTFKEMNELHIFEHWLTDEQKKGQKRLTEALLETMASAQKPAAGKAAASKGSRTGKSRGGRSRKTAASTAAVAEAAEDNAEVLGLFG